MWPHGCFRPPPGLVATRRPATGALRRMAIAPPGRLRAGGRGTEPGLQAPDPPYVSVAQAQTGARPGTAWDPAPRRPAPANRGLRCTPCQHYISVPIVPESPIYWVPETSYFCSRSHTIPCAKPNHLEISAVVSFEHLENIFHKRIQKEWISIYRVYDSPMQHPSVIMGCDTWVIPRNTKQSR